MDTVNLCIDIGNTTTKAALYIGREEIAYIKPFTAELFKELVSTHSPRVLVSKTGSNPELESPPSSFCSWKKNHTHCVRLAG